MDLIDYGDFVVHIFDEKARRFYDPSVCGAKRTADYHGRISAAKFFETRSDRLIALSGAMREAVSLAERVAATTPTC
jgi:hypothetical protein